MNERIIELRKYLGLTQKEFGSKLNMAHSSISEIEQCKKNILDRNIVLICKTFNVNEEWLRYGTGSMFVEIDVKYNEFFTIFNSLSKTLQEHLLIVAKDLLSKQNLL